MPVARKRSCVVALVCAVSLAVMPGCVGSTKIEATGAGHEWCVVPQSGVSADFFGDDPLAEGGLPVLSFAKVCKERRLLALEIRPVKDVPAAKALELKYLLSLPRGQSARLVLLLFEEEGSAWYKMSPQPLRALDSETGYPLDSKTGPATTQEWCDEDAELSFLSCCVRLPLTGFRQAAFSRDADGQLGLDHVRKAWIGLALDGPVKGSLWIRSAAFTSEPFQPTEPLRVTADSAGLWTIAKDPAVRARLSTPKEGPHDKACMKFEFTFPLNRHMFALPKIQLPEAEYEGYGALRFAYKAQLPKGIDALLVSVFEQDGSQYYATPAPPPSRVWRTVTLPFASFKLGEWSRDENGQLDLQQIRSVLIGLHGTAKAAPGTGVILATDVEFVPRAKTSDRK